MSISLAQEAFTGGEWSPSLHSRTAHAKYQTACAKMLNFYPQAHGGSSNRAGFEYIAGVKTHSEKVRLRRFQFNTEQAYMIEFGNQFARFFYQGAGQITLTAQNITGITKANPAVLTYSGADTYANGDRVFVSGVLGMVEVNNREFTVANVNVGANTFELSGIDSTSYTTYTSGGTVAEIYEISTPYVEADLPLLKFEQSNDTLYICHPSYAPRKLTRTGHTAWTLSTITFGASVSAPTGLAMAGAARFFAVTAVDVNGNESVPSSSEEGAPGNTLTWNAVAAAVEYNVYEVLNSTYQFVTRTATNSWVAPATVTPDPDIAAPSAQTPFGSSNNYPQCVAFWKQRLGFAGTNNDPQKFWLSVAGDFENMNISSPLQDDDAISAKLNASQVNEIRWMAELKYLAIGTAGGEFRVFAGGSAESITPTSLDSEKVSDWGVSDAQPLLIGSSLLFIDSSKKIVRDMYAAIDPEGNDGYSGNDLTILASHLFTTYGITEWCYESGQASRIWGVREDGKIVGMTYHREHQIYGWHLHETNGTVENIDSIRTADGKSEVWLVVKRTINGATKRFIERMDARDFVDIEPAFFVDAGLTYDGSVAATLTPGTGATVATTTGVTFTAGSSVFVSGDVGRFIYYRYYDSANSIYKTAKAEITGYTSGTVVTCTIRLAFPSLTAIAASAWRLTVTTISGLFHLAGESVVALADGSVVDGLTVSSGGIITLTEAASLVHVGKSYTCDLETLDFVYATRSGTVQDRVKSIPTAVLRFENTRECNVGPDSSHLKEIQFRTTENYGEPTRLFNDDKRQSISPGTDARSARIFVRTTNPLPCTVQAIYPQVTHGDL